MAVFVAGFEPGGVPATQDLLTVIGHKHDFAL